MRVFIVLSVRALQPWPRRGRGAAGGGECGRAEGGGGGSAGRPPGAAPGAFCWKGAAEHLLSAGEGRRKLS